MSEHGGVGKEPSPKRDAVFLVVSGQELCLELCHIDVCGTFALAGLALEAEIQRPVKFRAAQGFRGKLARQRRPKKIGATAGRVFFFTSDHVRRTHGPTHLPAISDADTSFDRRGKAPLLQKPVMGLYSGCPIPFPISEVLVHLGRIIAHNLAGIEHAVWVQKGLHLTEGFLELPVLL